MTALRLRNDVALAPIAAEHGPRIAGWLADPAVRAGLGARDDAAFLAGWLRAALAREGIWAFAIVAAGEHVGNVTLDRADERALSVRLSVFVGDAGRRGQGIGAAAVWRACDFAFAELARRTVRLTVHADNARAAALYRRLGFRAEGRQREEFRLGERWLDTLYMGLHRRELPPVEFAPPAD